MQYIISSPLPDDTGKIRPRAQLSMALKNRPGAIATDFTYTLVNGSKEKMKNIKADYTLLFFNNPDCHDCKRVKEHIDTSPVFRQLTAGGTQLAILAFYPDSDLKLWKQEYYPPYMINGYDSGGKGSIDQSYDLRAIPCFYLLVSSSKMPP